MSVTRRHFLMQLAASSGYTAAYAAMTSLGLGAASLAAAASSGSAQQAGYLTTSTPKNKPIAGGVWSQGPWGVSLHATRYGKTESEATFYSGPNIYSTSVFNHIENKARILTDLEVRYALSKQWQLALGASCILPPMRASAASRGTTSSRPTWSTIRWPAIRKTPLGTAKARATATPASKPITWP